MKYIGHGDFMRLTWMKMSTSGEDVIFAKFSKMEMSKRMHLKFLGKILFLAKEIILEIIK